MTKKTTLILIVALVVLLIGIYTYKHHHTSPKVPQDPQSYIVKGGKVYYRTVMQVNEGPDVVSDYEMKGADAKTFTILDYSWAKDKDTVFYSGQPALPKNTSPIDALSFTTIKDYPGLVKDKHAVYMISSTYTSPNDGGWFYELIPDADPVTFEVLGRYPYAKDKKNVYYINLPNEIKKINGVDASTFAVLGECAVVEVSRAYYAWDAKSVIAGNAILKGVDRDTFKIVAGFNSGPDSMYMAGTYSVDKNHVYKNCGEVIPTGNPATCSPGNLKECE